MQMKQNLCIYYYLNFFNVFCVDNKSNLTYKYSKFRMPYNDEILTLSDTNTFNTKTECVL